MPKIIENLPQRLTEEARQQIEASGYGAMTIRSVAKKCGVGVGTVYNYYPSKEALVAAFLLEDWRKCIDAINVCAESAVDPEPVLQVIYDKLLDFIRQHGLIFRDEAAASGFTGSQSRYHSLLRTQLAQPLRKFCRDDFTGEFIAEAVLTWTVAGTSFEQLYRVLKPLF